MQITADDSAVVVDQQGVRDRMDAVLHSCRACPAFVIGHLRPCDTEPCDGFLPCSRIFIERNPYDLKLPLVVGINLDQIGHGLTAGATPAGPEIDEDELALAYVVG